MNLSNSILSDISIHYVGNRQTQGDLILSQKPLIVNEFLSLKLRDYFLNKFLSTPEVFCFTHASSLKYNEIYCYLKDFFSKGMSFQKLSENIAIHLHENSVHPKIRSGELYVCKFKNCVINDKAVDAIGIFKTEIKSGFFEIKNVGRDFSIKFREGIDLKGFDKGCIVLNSSSKEGFEVKIIDNQNHGQEAAFWRENFLGLKPVSNEFSNTYQVLTITKDFITNELPKEFGITLPDKINYLNRSIEYFDTRENFTRTEFTKEVFQDSRLIKSFQEFDNAYRNLNELESADTFEISNAAVKNRARIFKSVLKLDKNFHVYIHGDRNLIQQGVEKDGRKFYKIYFTEEH